MLSFFYNRTHLDRAVKILNQLECIIVEKCEIIISTLLFIVVILIVRVRFILLSNELYNADTIYLNVFLDGRELVPPSCHWQS